MSHRKKRPGAEVTAAIRRVSAEGRLPLSELCELAGASELTLVSWASEGRRGVYLDAVCHRGQWFSSEAAILRFLTERARAELDCEPAG